MSSTFTHATRIPYLAPIAGLLIGFTGAAQTAHAAEPTVWPRPEQRQVYYAPTPQLVVRVTHLGADAAYWDQLDISVSYPADSLKQQAESVRAQYPGQTAQRVSQEVHGEWTVRIPTLGIADKVAPMQGQLGPYANLTYFVSKAQSTALRAAARTLTLASLEGRLASAVPDQRAVERLELDASVCRGLVAQGSTLYHAIRGFSEIEKRIEAQPARYESSREALKRSVLESCLEPASLREVRSFRELLNTEVTLSARPVRPAGETRKVVPVTEESPLKYEVIQLIDAEAP